MSAVDVTLRIGGVFATHRDGVIRTVLGSCIAVCLFDPISRVGGMNHYMLPYMDAGDPDAGLDPTRYGLQAMEVLIGMIQRLGGRRDRLQAKLFGGGHVLRTQESSMSVPSRNIEFIEQFVLDENINVVSQDLGGLLPRRVHFHPTTGKALVKRLGAPALLEIALEEQRLVSMPPPPPRADITLF